MKSDDLEITETNGVDNNMRFLYSRLLWLPGQVIQFISKIGITQETCILSSSLRISMLDQRPYMLKPEDVFR